MSNKVYDILKWIAIIVLPALKEFIEPVFDCWGIPYGAEISFTLGKLSILLGACLCVSSVKYARDKINAKMEAQLEDGADELAEAIEEENTDDAE